MKNVTKLLFIKMFVIHLYLHFITVLKNPPTFYLGTLTMGTLPFNQTHTTKSKEDTTLVTMVKLPPQMCKIVPNAEGVPPPSHNNANLM